MTGGGRDAAPFNVLLTCYTLFERDSSEQKLDRSFLKKWRWSHMVLVRAVCPAPSPHALQNKVQKVLYTLPSCWCTPTASSVVPNCLWKLRGSPF